MTYNLDTVFDGGTHDGQMVKDVIVEDKKYVVNLWKNGTRFSDEVIAALGFKKTATRILTSEEIAERKKLEEEEKKKRKISITAIEAELDAIEKEGRLNRGEGPRKKRKKDSDFDDEDKFEDEENFVEDFVEPDEEDEVVVDEYGINYDEEI